MSKYVKLGVILLVLAGLGFAIHGLVLSGFGLEHYWSETSYTLWGLYAFGAIASLLIAVLMFLADFALPKYISFVFLGCILLKAIASYLFIQNGLNLFENDFIELNFLVTFFIFLLYDIYVAYLLVNQDVKIVEK
ncbi:hypothetical protein PQ465_16980 [Sphingobacterium oryzagri]|uniref:Uncharacterized protein n=1 Tax=Sphingobacterium oryzagri TaxID=3025669 RepID=A0ABY7WEB3_9SPHI|nr:hypothetical protein [Sphingobacterium sp. KACC 22765]WDF67983.1 hypothetical protein PQ465_16980 [Sphingobacterium sp. KACC 22765]